MKTIKLLLMGLLLFSVTTFTCCAAGVIETLTGTSDITSFTAKFQKYMDTTKLAAFITAYQTNATQHEALSFEAFTVKYLSEHPDFQADLLAAVKKYAEENGGESELVKDLKKQIEDLKKQIDDMKNLSEEEKKKYKELLDKYAQQSQQILDQIANSNNALNKALKNLTKPQQMDPMQLIMMILMMLMMGGGGGGGGCSGGKCG